RALPVDQHRPRRPDPPAPRWWGESRTALDDPGDLVGVRGLVTVRPLSLLTARYSDGSARSGWMVGISATIGSWLPHRACWSTPPRLPPSLGAVRSGRSTTPSVTSTPTW